MPKIKLGDRAPVFSLPDQANTIHTLSDYQGQWVLLYFYPRDNTPGCTIEACEIRDNFSEFTRLKAVVFGISKDSAASHQKFIQKYKLPFTLLVDENKEVVKKYGVWSKKKFMGREFMGINRISFLIDPKGRVVKIYENVKPKEHAQEVLKDLQVLSKS